MTILASAASVSGPIVAIVSLVVLGLLGFRAGIVALGFKFKVRALWKLDLVIVLSLVVFAICVYERFKLIG
jgi:hypothetical protein